MLRIRQLQRRFLRSVGVGVAAAALSYLPPLHLAGRLDGLLYSAWSRIDPPEAPADMLLVSLASPAELAGLEAIAQAHGAKLLVTTALEPPPSAAGALALGPVDIPVGELRLQRTGWSRGGHLWLRPDVDGVVRHDWPALDAAEPSPSLAYFAAASLETAGSLGPPARHADGAGRRWLRFYAPESFAHATAGDVATEPARVAGKVLIAGEDRPPVATPLGPMSAHELLAHAVAGYREGRAVRASPLATALPWAVAAALVGAAAFVPSAMALPAAAAGGAALIGASAGGFLLAGLWLPVTAPTLLLIATGAAEALGERRRPARARLKAARRAAADGRLGESWTLYRQVPATPALLDELYRLGRALEAADDLGAAADVYYRVAQIDGRFRDAAQRLVRCGRPRPTTEHLVQPPVRLPAMLDRYELLEPIGRGAMGYVYLGRDSKINRIVAIKAVDLKAEFEPADVADARERFLREAETAGRLSHPNIVTIFDVGETDGLAYIAMEYLRGRHLSDFAVPEALLPAPTVLQLLSRAADALHYAHCHNVVHRDIKPANIMYDSASDSLKITDFGIARMIDASRTRTGIVLGTPAFMSPEQVEGKNVNGHTDLFALGVSLYQLLTGQLPFRGASMTNLMFVIANEPHPAVTAVRPDLPPLIDEIVDRALAKDPADRYSSGAEMAAALRAGAAALA
ncbi:MAG TPA: protein kinase [Gammaproteobacteria bacterium]